MLLPPVHGLSVGAGKYGSNIHVALWRNVPFFVLPFWAASVLFSRPRQMPVITADKVSFCRQKQGGVFEISSDSASS